MHKTDDDNEQDGVPDIERLRAERVARNAAVLAALGVSDAAAAVEAELRQRADTAAAARAARLAPEVGTTPRPRSSRAASQKAALRLTEADTDDESASRSSEDASASGRDSEPVHSSSRKRLRSSTGRATERPGLAAADVYAPSENELDSATTSSSSFQNASDLSADRSSGDADGDSKAARQRGKPARTSAAAAVATAKPEPMKDDWELQLALQMSLQHAQSADDVASAGVNDTATDQAAALPAAAADAHAAAPSASAPTGSCAGADARGRGRGRGRKQQRPAAAAADCGGGGSGGESGAPAADASDDRGRGRGRGARRGGNQRGRSRGRGRAAAAPAAARRALADCSSDDAFELFAMLQPTSGGLLGASQLAAALERAGMDGDRDLAQRMLTFAKALAAQSDALLCGGSSEGVRASTGPLEYEEFLLLVQQL